MMVRGADGAVRVLGTQPDTGGHTGKRQCQLAQRDGVGRDRAAVGAAWGDVQVVSGGSLQRIGDLPHHRMPGLHVTRQKPARLAIGDVAAQADEARVLAGAVVVQCGRLLARCGHRLQGPVVVGPVRTALQGADVQPGLVQHRRRGGRVHALAAVRRAGQRQFGIAQAEAVGRARRHQRQRLQHLDGRSREDRSVDVTERGVERAIGIDDGDRAAVEGLDDPAACDFDEDRGGEGGRMHPATVACRQPDGSRRSGV